MATGLTVGRRSERTCRTRELGWSADDRSQQPQLNYERRTCISRQKLSAAAGAVVAVTVSCAAAAAEDCAEGTSQKRNLSSRYGTTHHPASVGISTNCRRCGC